MPPTPVDRRGRVFGEHRPDTAYPIVNQLPKHTDVVVDNRRNPERRFRDRFVTFPYGVRETTRTHDDAPPYRKRNGDDVRARRLDGRRKRDRSRNGRRAPGVPELDLVPCVTNREPYDATISRTSSIVFGLRKLCR